MSFHFMKNAGGQDNFLKFFLAAILLVATSTYVVATVTQVSMFGKMDSMSALMKSSLAALSFSVSDNQEPGPVPTITSITPDSALVESEDLDITVNGTNFVDGSVIWFDSPVETTFVSATQLTATIPSPRLINSVIVSVLVRQPDNETDSNTVPFWIRVVGGPIISSISPTSALIGGPDIELTVNGTNFVPDSAISCGTAQQPTTYVSATQLTATITSGHCDVIVYNPAPGGVSNLVVLVGNSPVPEITSISETEMLAGSPGFDLYISGTNFQENSIVRLNDLDLGTGYISSTQLRRYIPAENITSTGVFDISVFDPAPGGGISDIMLLSVYNPEPVIDSISPDFAPVGSPNTTITINGTGFIDTSTAMLIGLTSADTSLATTYVSSSQLTTVVPTARLAAVESYLITVVNPAPGGGSSSTMKFEVSRSQLVIMKNTIGGNGTFNFRIAPVASAPVSETEFESIDTATEFTPYNGSTVLPELPGTTYSVKELTSEGWALDSVSCLMAGGIPTGEPNIADGRIDNVTILVGQTTTCTFNSTKNEPDLTVRAVNPNEATVGSDDDVSITVTGTGFVETSEIFLYRGLDGATPVGSIATSYVSSTELTGVIPASWLSERTTYWVRALNNPLFSALTLDAIFIAEDAQE